MNISIDTNILVRLLVSSDDQTTNLILNELKKAEAISLSSVVLAETIFVLEKVYKLTKKDYLQQLLDFCTDPKLIDQETNIASLAIYSKHNLHFVDCHCLAFSQNNKTNLFTLDKKLNKLAKKSP